MTTSAPVIGVVGNDVPRQLLLALGARPHRLTGSWTGAIDPDAAQLLGATDAVVARLLTELRSDAQPLDALIVCNDSQAHLRLFYVLRATASTVPVHLLDMPRDASEPARRFARFQLEALAAFCAAVTGRRLDAASLAAAADAEAAVGDALRRLRARRRADPPLCAGADALDAMLDAARLAPSEAVARLDAARAPVSPGAMRVHVTGSSHPDAAFYRELESEGRCVIVSEDHDTGEAAWLGEAVRGETTEHVLEGLSDAHFARVTTSATTSGSVRAAFTGDIAREAGADAVAAIIRELDEAPLWDLTDQRDVLEGIPFISGRVTPGEEIDAARDLVRELVDAAVSA
ncbi:2-hydroxyacyl-CoA dehydratase family protein [Microbacterium sp. HD4P20]|uniref:2-hydroxyacyl-CoA dehydratase n=1 Tax=Microbacterium sp. HD4P20 TaxID=2864874 RepID=UPI001C63D222|nr:2-hydroxyacyl-CoA dehydratase family protein [Microbacterium sp. HD4P20]MCP2635672.1 2-hydroxyacyl-CoA dehydratase family protein [Microbacterium sp. HD4P20]